MMLKRGSSKPPKIMTWSKASPAIIIAVLFDAIRGFFTFFWFFGPTALGVYCVNKVGDVWAIGKVLTAGCATGATMLGFYSFPVTAVFGSVMAMVVGFAGWLIVGGWLLATNSRIFKENAIWFIGSLVVSEIPFVGAIPAITIAVWKMYHTQIKKERAVFKQWKNEQASIQLQEQRQQMEELAQYRAVQLDKQAEQQEALNEEVEEMNGEIENENEIHQEKRMAA